MLQYLIILLDETSTSFCNYQNPKTGRCLIPLETLRQGIRFGMMENLMIQFVYPDYELPKEYQEVIETIDHSKIKPQKECADVWVIDEVRDISSDIPVVLRTNKEYLFAHVCEIAEAIGKVSRLNIVLTDLETFTSDDFAQYKSLLEELSYSLEQLYVEGKSPQLNLLTDRMVLSKMNNCGAGDTNIRKTTLEVNTPSREQCIMAHLERNASRALLKGIRKHGTFLPEMEIEEIDYLDPFDKRNEW